MKCAWNELLSILPVAIRGEVDKHGRDTLQELRLRLGEKVQMVTSGGKQVLSSVVGTEHLEFVINAASRYSPWARSSVSAGYLTARGGHRVGICGEAVVKDHIVTAISPIRSLNIRVARDFPGIAKQIADQTGNILIIGPPGSGKTTLLRDLIRQRAECETVCVVDSRGELFPSGVFAGASMDIMYGCSKPVGIEMLLRNMTPETIAIDEITADADCAAMLEAAWCGVHLLATAHAGNLSDLCGRKVYEPIIACGLFRRIIVLDKNKNYQIKRIDQ